MKLLIDESIDVRLRRHVAEHSVFTVQYMRWKGKKNGELVALAAAESFDAIVTTDSAMPDQLNVGTLPLAIIVLRAASNDLGDLESLVPALLRELNHLRPQSIVRIDAP